MTQSAQTPIRILVVDDELNITQFLQVGLSYEGYTVEVASDGRDGLQRARSESFDLLILDIMLPGLDGFEFCRQLRAVSQMPVLMLTAKDGVHDRVVGLDTGADDYLVKPFNFLELLARVRAVLRRSGVNLSHVVLEWADVSLNRDAREVRHAGQVVNLTPKEFDLLEFFMSHPRQVFRREAILNRVWGYDFAGDTSAVDVHVGHLRDKLGDRPPRLLQTVRGVGYVWREET